MKYNNKEEVAMNSKNENICEVSTEVDNDSFEDLENAEFNELDEEDYFDEWDEDDEEYDEDNYSDGCCGYEYDEDCYSYEATSYIDYSRMNDNELENYLMFGELPNY